MNEQTITVRFNSVEEFLEELGKAPPNIVKLLRLTKTFLHSKEFPLQNVSVLATFMRHVWISDHVAVLERVELTRPCGQIHDHMDDDTSKRVLERADAVMLMIEKNATSQGIEVRAGTYE